MIKLIDRYIIRKFLGTFFLTIALILAIAVVFDISEKIDDFLTKGASFKEIIFDYYLNFLVFYGNLFCSMIVFIATIFFTSRMAANTEVVAILTGGVSFRRLMWPYFISATIVAGLSLVLSHFVIPRTNVTMLDFKHTYIDMKQNERYKNIHRQIEPGHIVYFENYNTERYTGFHFSYEIFDGQNLKYKLKADFIKLDTATGLWRLDNYYIRTIDSLGVETLNSGRRLDTNFSFNENEIVPKLYSVEMMDTPTLLEFIDTEKLRGSENLAYYEIEKHKRTSWPIATYVLVLIGVSISSKKSRGGLGLNIAFGLAVCVTYIFFMQISTTLATVGDFSPALAVWFPNVVFSFVATYLYSIAPK